MNNHENDLTLFQEGKNRNNPKAINNFYSFWRVVFRGAVDYALVVASLLGLILVITFLVYRLFGFGNWTGFFQYENTISSTATNSGNVTSTITKSIVAGKTLWDLAELMFVPLTLVLIAYFFNKKQKEYEFKTAQQQRDLEREIANNRLQETALQNYFDRMSSLLLNEKLFSLDEFNDSEDYDEISINHKARIIARAHTLSILESLSGLQTSGTRKGRVIQFLYEAGLITDEQGTVDLKGANLRSADLSERDLAGVQLESVDLRGAKLSYAILGDANFYKANLRGAFLDSADLGSANFSEANLYGALLIEANLFDANLKETNLIKADLTNADLWLANLNGADLSYTDLSFANLNGANLYDTTLKETQLLGAKYDDSTIWPEGFDPKQIGAEKEALSTADGIELPKAEDPESN